MGREDKYEGAGPILEVDERLPVGARRGGGDCEWVGDILFCVAYRSHCEIIGMKFVAKFENGKKRRRTLGLEARIRANEGAAPLE